MESLLVGLLGAAVGAIVSGLITSIRDHLHSSVEGQKKDMKLEGLVSRLETSFKSAVEFIHFRLSTLEDAVKRLEGK